MVPCSICLWLISLSIVCSKFQLFQVTRFPSFLRLNFMCLYVCVYVAIFLIHSPISGYLGCFYSLAIVYNVAVNARTQTLLQYNGFVSFLICTQKWHSWFCGSPIFNFLKNVHTVFLSVLAVYLPTNSAQAFPFLCILMSPCYLLSF